MTIVDGVTTRRALAVGIYLADREHLAADISAER